MDNLSRPRLTATTGSVAERPQARRVGTPPQPTPTARFDIGLPTPDPFDLALDVVSTIRSLRSLLDHLTSRPSGASEWFETLAGARSSTTEEP